MGSILGLILIGIGIFNLGIAVGLKIKKEPSKPWTYANTDEWIDDLIEDMANEDIKFSMGEEIKEEMMKNG